MSKTYTVEIFDPITLGSDCEFTCLPSIKSAKAMIKKWAIGNSFIHIDEIQGNITIKRWAFALVNKKLISIDLCNFGEGSQ